MTIALKPEHQKVIDRAIQSGAYHDPAEVIGAALEILGEELNNCGGQPRKSRLWEPRKGLSLGYISSIHELIEEHE